MSITQCKPGRDQCSQPSLWNKIDLRSPILSHALCLPITPFWALWKGDHGKLGWLQMGKERSKLVLSACITALHFWWSHEEIYKTSSCTYWQSFYLFPFWLCFHWMSGYICSVVWNKICTLIKKSWLDQEDAYSKGGEVKYLLKSKTSVDLFEFNSQSPF